MVEVVYIQESANEGDYQEMLCQYTVYNQETWTVMVPLYTSGSNQ